MTEAVFFLIIQRKIIDIRTRISIPYLINNSKQHGLSTFIAELSTSYQNIHCCLLDQSLLLFVNSSIFQFFRVNIPEGSVLKFVV